jgi:hypothetical protein
VKRFIFWTIIIGIIAGVGAAGINRYYASGPATGSAK